MKKLILFVMLLLCIDLSAQRQSKSRYHLGYKLGMVSAKMTGGRVKSGSRIVFEGGVWCQIKMSKSWSGQVEVIYVEKGIGSLPKNRPAGFGEYAVSIMYLECPVLFQYHLKKCVFEAGPGLGVLIYQYETLIGAPASNMTGTYPFTKKELSFNVGFGYSLNDKWYLGMRYTHSLLPVRKQIPDISKQVYNRVFAFSVARHISYKKSKAKDSQVEN